MNKTNNEILNQILSTLREDLHPAVFDTFFGDLKLLSINDDRAIFQTADKVRKDVISQRYTEQFRSEIYEATGKAVAIEIVTESEVEADPAIRAMIGDDVQAPELPANQFNPRYTFDNFIVGDNNKFTHALCLAVAESPGTMYNPLFLYGGVGLGKTHLMHAIGNHINERFPEKRVLYVTAEKFTNDFIRSLSGEGNDSFRATYRSVDVLLIDDIQFLCGKNRSQEEFFHTFNTLRQANAQIICTSDKSPKEMPNLEERLRSRFEWGVISDIKSPDLETRIAILRRKALDEQLDVDDEVFLYIANKIDSNVRELEGALNRVAAWGKLLGKKVDMKIASEALNDYFQGKTKVVDVDLILEVVCEHFNIKKEDILGKRRDSEITTPRHIAMYLCREMTDMSLPNIGRAFGGRHHTTVINGCDNIRDEIKLNKTLRLTVDDLKKKINEA